MKKNIVVLLIALIAVSLFVGCKKEPEIKTYKVGDKGPAGGIIFYVNPDAEKDGWTYLEAAPEDLDKQYCFGFYRTSEHGEDSTVDTSTKVGTGKSNTEKLVNAMKAEAYKWTMNNNDNDSIKTEYAAKVCADYECGGYDDWFLPSKEELALMYKELKDAGKGGEWQDGESDSWYWSSSEYNAGSAYKQLFYDSTPESSARSGAHWVRPVRSF